MANDAQSPADAVRVNDLHLRLTSAAGPVHVLRGIDLRVSVGETVSVIGPSGSGKTSLLLVIAGLERPTSGSIIAAGNEITRLDEDALALFRRDNVGLVFQDFHLVPTMTAIENVALPLEFTGHDDAFARAEAQLSTVGLAARGGHYPAQLSGGEQQRVAMARAFVTEPAILLADEPTGNLDGETGRAVIDVLFEMHARRNSTLLLVTHEVSVADRCARQIHLVDGRIANDTRNAPASTAAPKAGP
ncbi:MAG TPA: ABC transporter ATP-binding protein [Rhodospirillales bacterium]|nr:ABC transporter ATP-binding protein [Rhodospirillales bacterium]HJO69236.1 ABC transporter ATP-binding protein [Rhodospirillales bacterium]